MEGRKQAAKCRASSALDPFSVCAHCIEDASWVLALEEHWLTL